MDTGDEDIIVFWKLLYKYQVEYIMVGGFAAILHGTNRVTEDVDIWIKDTLENRKKFRAVFKEMGFGDYVQFETMQFIPGWTTLYISSGIELDVMTSLKGFEQEKFDYCYDTAYTAMIDEVPVRFLHINQLIEAKKAAGREKDLLDVAELEKIRKITEENKNK